MAEPDAELRMAVTVAVSGVAADIETSHFLTLIVDTALAAAGRVLGERLRGFDVAVGLSGADAIRLVGAWCGVTSREGGS